MSLVKNGAISSWSERQNEASMFSHIRTPISLWQETNHKIHLAYCQTTFICCNPARGLPQSAEVNRGTLHNNSDNNQQRSSVNWIPRGEPLYKLCLKAKKIRLSVFVWVNLIVFCVSQRQQLQRAYKNVFNEQHSRHHWECSDNSS